jgi:DNA-binding transcriptional LysR family regulator
MLAPARRILGDVELMLAGARPFEPRDLRRLVQIAVPDFVSAPLMAAVVGRLRREAPHCSLIVRPVRGDAEGAELLSSGQADVLIESRRLPSGTLHVATLFEDAVLSVAARGNAHAFEGMTVEQYLELPHVAAAPASGLQPGLIDTLLAERGLARRVVAWMPYLNSLPSILAGSDLVFTTTAHLATHLAAQGGLKRFVPPVPFPPVRYLLMWHDRVHRSPEHAWLRRVIRDAVAEALPAP